MWPSTAHASKQLDLWCSMSTYTISHSATLGLHSIAHELLLIVPDHAGMARLSTNTDMVYLPTDGYPSKY